MRLAIAILVAVAVGGILGAFYAQQRLDARLQEATARLDSRDAEVRELEGELDRVQQRLDLSRGELSKMARERDALRDQLTALEETASTEQLPNLDAMEFSEPAAALEPEPIEAPAAGPPSPGESRDRRRGEGGPRDSPMRDPEARREFMARMRERSMGFIQDRIADTSDPVAQDRIAAIGDYLDYMMDLGSQMREAETDEDRAALRETMGQTRDELQGLVQQQQDYMMRELAQEYGIDSAEDQDEFITSLESMRQSPFFSSPMMQRGFGGPVRGRGGPMRPPGEGG